VLVTPGLLPWIKAGDIQPSIKGSDHCPVFVDFKDEITTDTGERLVLRNLMHMRDDAANREPPRLAAKHWPEFQGKQTLMSSFFNKCGTETKSPPVAAATTPRSALAAAFDALDTQLPPSSVAERPLSEVLQTPPSSQLDAEPSSSQSLVSPSSRQASLKPPQAPREAHKRPRTDTSTAGTPKPKKLKAGQSKLSSFFSMPNTAPRPKASLQATSSEVIDLCEDSEEVSVEAPSPPTTTSEIRLSPGTPSTSQGKESENGTMSVASWSALFTPIPPPLCTVHREPAKEWRVNKPGPNKGKTFYLCARPVGPGYDKGRTERLREEVDHQYKCNFFKWASDVKREAVRAGAAGAAGSGTKP
jgi:AP endonuclease 2